LRRIQIFDRIKKTISGGIMDKKDLRRMIREKKRAMTEEQIVAASRRLGALFAKHPLYRTARTIYGYLPYNQEVRTVPILEQALKDGKRVAVPKVIGDEMKFIYIEDFSCIVPGYCGIPEPVENGPEAHDSTALVLMPGLAFDPQGHRLGYGGGFYDRFLSAEPNHPTLALCYDFQMLEHLQTESFDIPVDCVIWDGME
jgi:5-formyltetrahydrofolate cyclo-ligase